MAVEDPCRIVEENLRTALQFFGRASGRGSILAREGLLLIDSGVDYAVFNIAMITEPVTTAARLELQVGLAAEWYAARHTRWSLWTCDDYLKNGLLRNADQLMARHRLRPLTKAPGMIAERLAPPTRFLPPMECRLVGDAQTRLDFAHLTALCFDIPFATSRAIYDPPDAWKGDYVGYVGYVKKRAACTVALVITDDAIGVYSVSTLPEFRRLGYAESLMRHVIREAQQVSGINRTILQATRAGHEIYRRMGFRDITSFSVHIL
jgi:GNAT superfamily N-acetyltransferase